MTSLSFFLQGQALINEKEHCTVNCLSACGSYVIQVRFIDKVLITCQHMVFCFVQQGNNSLLQPLYHDLSYMKFFLIDTFQH